MLGTLLAISPAGRAVAQLTEQQIEDRAAAAAEKRLDRLWNAQWREYAKRYFLYDGQYHLIINYDRFSKSSLPLSKAQLKQRTTTLEWRQRAGTVYVSKSRQLEPPDEDVDHAVSILPRLKPGHWGYIWSVAVDEEMDEPDSVRVTRLKFIDDAALLEAYQADLVNVREQTRAMRSTMNLTPDQIADFRFRFRRQAARLPSKPLIMTGFDRPIDVSPGDEWTGPFHVVLIDRGRGLEAIPMSVVEPGLNEEQFIDMLRYRGKSRRLFSQMIVEALERRLPTDRRDQAIGRWLEDFDPDEALARAEAPEQTDDPAAADQDSDGSADGEPTGPRMAAADDADDTSPPARPAPTDADVDAARRTLDTYLTEKPGSSDPEDDDEPIEPLGDDESIFDFGRDW